MVALRPRGPNGRVPPRNLPPTQNTSNTNNNDNGRKKRKRNAQGNPSSVKKRKTTTVQNGAATAQIAHGATLAQQNVQTNGNKPQQPRHILRPRGVGAGGRHAVTNLATYVPHTEPPRILAQTFTQPSNLAHEQPSNEPRTNSQDGQQDSQMASEPVKNSNTAEQLQGRPENNTDLDPDTALPSIEPHEINPGHDDSRIFDENHEALASSAAPSPHVSRETSPAGDERLRIRYHALFIAEMERVLARQGLTVQAVYEAATRNQNPASRSPSPGSPPPSYNSLSSGPPSFVSSRSPTPQLPPEEVDSEDASMLHRDEDEEEALARAGFFPALDPIPQDPESTAMIGASLRRRRAWESHYLRDFQARGIANAEELARLRASHRILDDYRREQEELENAPHPVRVGQEPRAEALEVTLAREVEQMNGGMEGMYRGLVDLNRELEELYQDGLDQLDQLEAQMREDDRQPPDGPGRGDAN